MIASLRKALGFALLGVMLATAVPTFASASGPGQKKGTKKKGGKKKGAGKKGGGRGNSL
jgi:hypothetical protein